MKKQLEWPPRAESDYTKLLEYLIGKWGKKTAVDFSAKLGQVLQGIVLMPLQYPSSGKIKNLRRCVVTKQTTLYNRVKPAKIELVALFDTRQHPSKIKPR